MKNKCKPNKSAYRLTFLIFSSIVISSIITVVFTMILVYVFRIDFKFLRNPFYMIVISLSASAIIASIISTISTKKSMAELNRFLNAIDLVSKGDFSIRLEPPKSLQMKVIYSNFNQMVNELSSIETLRSDFVSNFSHEFKTPIVSIRGFAKLLLDEELSDEDKKEFLQIIYQESGRLVMLSENTLNITKLETQHFVIEKKDYSLDEQIRRCVLLLQNQWESKNIKLSIELDRVTYKGSVDLMQQLFINLVSNAIKFSSDYGEIAITLSQFDDKIVFVISDNGIGMDQKTIDRVFDKFYQGDLSHTTEGNGLGLSIVKRITNLINGDIEVKSVPNDGTTIILTFK